MLTATDSISNVDDTAVGASVVVGNGVAANKEKQQLFNRHLKSNQVCVRVCVWYAWTNVAFSSRFTV